MVAEAVALREGLMELKAMVRPAEEIPREEERLAAYMAIERERLRVLESPEGQEWRRWRPPPH